MHPHSQILVVGGGPAGSTAAALLAREGFEVTLLERDVFPRYHIGESLLPSCLEILDLLGAREKIEAHGFQKKHGGYFAWGLEEWDLDFTKLRHPYSFQVVRSEFDQLLLEHAKSLGVKVFEGVEVKEITFDGDRPVSASWSRADDASEAGKISFDFLIDASGRAGILATHYFKTRRYNSSFQNIGIWGYWKGAKQLARASEGAIAVGSVPEGWLWGIPLHNGTMSIGLVTHKTHFKEQRQQGITLEQVYMNAINDCPLIQEIIGEEGELVTQVSAEQDYSYLSDILSGPRYFIAGDAACFIDPLLSTGVHLATFSGMLAAASISSVLRNEVTEEEARTFYAQSYKHAYLRLVVIVSGLYQQYNGKASYFWEAQQLSHHDYANSPDLSEAFLHVVTGMEDLLDAEESDSDAATTDGDGTVLDRHAEVLKSSQQTDEAARARSQLYNKVFMRFSLSPETAIDGLYVRTAPHLGLERAAEFAV